MNRGMNDRIGTVDSSPIRLGAPTPLEDHDQHAVRRADAEQVHHGGLQWHQQRAEHHHQQHEGQQHHGDDEQGQPFLDAVTEVGEHRHLAADVGPGRAVLRARPGTPPTAAGRWCRAWPRTEGSWSVRRSGPRRPSRASTCGGDTSAMPGSAAIAADQGVEHGRVARDVHGDDQRAVGAGAEARRRSGRRPAARCATAASCPRRGSRAGARSPAPRGRAAGRWRRRRTPWRGGRRARPTAASGGRVAASRR